MTKIVQGTRRHVLVQRDVPKTPLKAVARCLVLRVCVRALAMMAVLAFAISPSAAQEAKPQKTRGVSIAAMDALPLAMQLPRLKDYGLRIRQIVLEPGAVVGYHSHAHGPVVAYLVSGEYTEHRDGTGEVVHQPGEQWVEGADVAHWSENRGTEPAVLINVDIVRAQ